MAKKKSAANVNFIVQTDSSRKRKKPYPYAQHAKDLKLVLGYKYPRGSDASKNFWGPNFKDAIYEQRLLRKALNFQGQGAYNGRSLAKYGLRGAGALAGGMAGMPGGISSALSGAQAGWRQGANVSKFMGYGDYQNDVSTNSLITDDQDMNPQQQIQVNASSAEGDVNIEFTEFVQNIIVSSSGAGTTPFTLQEFSINPGLRSTFPWLSQIAPNFTLYEFQGLMFQYKPTSGEYGSTNSNSLGKVILATNYDPTAAAFTNSQAMENYDYAMASKPSCGMVHAVETAPMQRFSNQLYTRTGDTDKSLVLTDLGLFQVATEGIYTGAAGDFVIGELWVTYKVKLSRKFLGDASLGLNCLYDAFHGESSNNSLMTSADMVLREGSSIGGSIVYSYDSTTFSTWVYTFPVNLSNGYYAVTCNCQIDTDAVTGAYNPIFESISAVNAVVKSDGVNKTRLPNIQTNLNGPITWPCGFHALVSLNAPGTQQATFKFVLGANALNNIKLTFAVTQVAASYYLNTGN